MTLKSLVRQNLFWRSSFIGSGLLVSILLAQSLKPAFTGSMYYDIALLTFYIQIAGLSLESGINFFAASKKADEASLGMISLIWTFLILIIAGGAYNLIGKENLGIKSIGVDTKMILAFIGGNVLYSYFSALFFAKLNFRIPNLLGTLINVLICLVALAKLNQFIVLSEEDIIGMFLYSFLIKGLLVAIWHYSTSKSFFKFNFKILPGIFKYSLFACIANLLTFLLNRFDYFFVEKYCSEISLGNYIQVSKISQLFFMVPAMMSAVYFPVISGSSEPFKYVSQIRKSSRFSLFLAIASSSLLIITGYWLFPYAFGKDFNDMYWPFLLMVPGIIAFSSIFHITAFFAARNQIWVNIKGTTLALIFLFTFDPFVIQLFGIYGAASVISASYLVYAFYIMNAFRKESYRLNSAANVIEK